ncbi:16S rRNA processing protein RimM [Sedimentibacter acidaminivorans]|jgi:16S rRNA processing protein RimM|uniref:Ribosome maturation factor RimM n=1 Tax=Sedimentibacter acidaminivorans TaxID=913099 RepID=A0ABS4GCQ4_9FIRM|nr:ribosome maturation factor RimM [Sedimentibacter acidaminivorans]MBP1925468.1 16S rRNA processing protein RimM [Sedimentibacter acidaminivorans]
MKDYIKVGKIVNTHGVKGCIKCVPFTDDLERFDDLEYVYTEKDNIKRKIKEVWYRKGTVYLTLENIEDMSTAESFKNSYISIFEDQLRDLPEDTYYLFELEGMKVYSDEGEYIGEISEIYQPGANDVYEIKNNDKTYLIPAVKEVVKEVNMKDRKIIINVIEGLLE